MLILGTLFSSIYKKFLGQISDSELARLENDDLKELMKDYLENSAAVEFKKCRKNLNKIYTPQKATFSLSLTDKDKVDFSILNKLNEIIENIQFVEWEVSYKDKDSNLVELVENEDYIIELKTSNKEDKLVTDDVKFVLLNRPQVDLLIIKCIFDGAFEDELDNEEQFILALGMVMNWLQPKKLREENLRQTMGDRDFKGFSNANMLAQLNQLEKSTKIKLREYKRAYSYTGFKGLS